MERSPEGSDARGRAELARARRLIASGLGERGIDVRDDDAGRDLEALLTAVEAFEHARARLGGDSFTNSLDSVEPDDVAFVIPRRLDGERASAYADRVRRVASRLARRANDA